MNDETVEQLQLLNILKTAGVNLSNKRICEMTETQKEEYDALLAEFVRVNKIRLQDRDCPPNIREMKGLALEKISRYLLAVSGSIFEVSSNLRTTTNEIDVMLRLNTKGALLQSLNLLDSKFSCFIGECKNYNKKVDVTYVGKFCSLMLTNRTKLGILFSYHGVSGTGWKDACGLIRKFYLHKENEEDRYCIIDFNIKDFQAVSAGENFLDIVSRKMLALKFDTDYTAFLSKHPAE